VQVEEGVGGDDGEGAAGGGLAWGDGLSRGSNMWWLILLRMMNRGVWFRRRERA
jgi:hypothetical protein